MIKTNNIDIFLLREELLEIFQELILQIRSEKPGAKTQFNIVNKLSKNSPNLITILDSDALNQLINKKFIFNNYIFIIGKINKNFEKYLDENFINYECFETPISFLKLIMHCNNLSSEIDNYQSEILELKQFSYSFYLNRIFNKNSSLYLTDKENEIFQFLITNIGTIIKRKDLLSNVWRYSESIDTHTLETHIYTLRKKIKKKLGLANIILYTDDGYQIKD